MTRTLKLKQSRLVPSLAVAFSGFILAAAGAAEPRDADDVERETREFKVSVDGKERGKCTIRIACHEDGAETMKIAAALRFNYVVYEYRYSSAGTETWKNGRLIALENTADFNGTKYVLKAGSTDKGLRVAVNGKVARVDPDVWGTSYWRLPDRLAEQDQAEGNRVVPAGGRRPSRKAGAVFIPLLDSDKGRELRGEVRRIGQEKVAVGRRVEPCTHYKVSGDVEVDVWYDARRRLVRQETVESGHKTLMELTRIAAE